MKQYHSSGREKADGYDLDNIRGIISPEEVSAARGLLLEEVGTNISAVEALAALDIEAARRVCAARIPGSSGPMKVICSKVIYVPDDPPSFARVLLEELARASSESSESTILVNFEIVDGAAVGSALEEFVQSTDSEANAMLAFEILAKKYVLEEQVSDWDFMENIEDYRRMRDGVRR